MDCTDYGIYYAAHDRLLYGRKGAGIILAALRRSGIRMEKGVREIAHPLCLYLYLKILRMALQLMAKLMPSVESTIGINVQRNGAYSYTNP